MWDIYLGIAIMMLLAVGLFALGLWAGRRGSKPQAAACGLAGISVALLHVFVFRDDPRLARLLPFTNLCVVANWAPLGVGLLGGVAAGSPKLQTRRGCVLTALLIVLGLYHAYGWLLEPPPQCRNTWRQGVCRQSTDSSCSAASAATLLKHHGIPATEPEMARLCLTRWAGTSNHGLYRGLKLKTAGSALDVEVLTWSYDELLREFHDPVIGQVCLPGDAHIAPIHDEEWGLPRDLPHTVVLLEFVDGDRVAVADPMRGRVTWSLATLRHVWQGAVFRLVRR